MRSVTLVRQGEAWHITVKGPDTEDLRVKIEAVVAVLSAAADQSIH